ncbi:uncharacterized protein LOC132066189 [Lycium ferocissimum]|uniref:uncharacterized protein LOC132066189 n=1 Tax=Lycium ferocissimum TaxID=112874 RepID=UPI00281622DD|nr:uncharacterized protein LOC132066189 [Lycium ferocissimum]
MASYLREHKIKLAGLVETRVKEPKAKEIINRITPRWDHANNYTKAVNGRIWLLWDPNVYEVQVLAQEAQLIHCNVVNRQMQMECDMTIIYGYNTIEQRKELWDQLSRLSTQCSKPWILWGDFNTILYTQDRVYGAAISNAKIRDFSDCVQNLMVTELPWQGDYYTWSNKQQGGNKVWSRIDRALGNLDWMMIYGHLTIEYNLPHISNHAPMMIRTNQTIPYSKSPFKFFNVWLNNSEFKGVTTRITQTRLDLKYVQTMINIQYSDALANEEKQILQQLEKWTLIKESIIQQKSRVSWIKLGDSNTSYFFAVLKERKQRKQIKELEAIGGGKLIDAVDIKEEIILFINH